MGDAKPFGKINDYWYRVEFQGRGTPHIHFLLWIDKVENEIKPEDLDDVDGEGIERVKKYVEKTFSCTLPEPWKTEQSTADSSKLGEDESLSEEDAASVDGGNAMEEEDLPANDGAHTGGNATTADEASDPTAPGYRPNVFGGGFSDHEHPCAQPVDDLRAVKDWGFDFEKKQFKNPEVHKNFRNILLAMQMHWCCATCHKYGHFYDCRFNHPWETHGDVSVTIDVDAKGRIRRRIEPPRNNEHINRHCRAPWVTCFKKGNSDACYCGDAHGAAAYCGSYSAKAEEPDSSMMANLISRSLSQRVGDSAARDFLRVTANSMLRSTVVGATQACWFLLGLPFVRKSRPVITVNVLPVDQMTTRLRSVPEMEAAVNAEGDEATAVDSSPGSNLGRRQAYSTFLKQFPDGTGITFNAFLSRYRFSRHPLPKQQKGVACEDDSEIEEQEQEKLSGVSAGNDPAVLFDFAPQPDGEVEASIGGPPDPCFLLENKMACDESGPPSKPTRKSTKIEWRELSEDDLATFDFGSDTGQIKGGPTHFLLPAAFGGFTRCIWMKQQVVINASPSIPFSLDSERSAFSTLLLHRAWPNGNEKDILDEGSTATATLKRASDDGELPEYAKLFIQDAATLEAAKDRQGKPGSGGLFPGASDDADAGSNADDDDDDIELEPSIDDALEGGPDLLKSPIVPIDYSSSQLLSKDKYQSFQNHVVKITHETTETLKKRNQRNSAEVFDRHVPFAQEIQSEMERQLKEDIESFPFAEEGKPSLQGDLFDHVENA